MLKYTEFKEFDGFTEKDFIDDKIAILKMLKRNKNLIEIEEEVDRTEEYVIRMCKILMSEGKISSGTLKTKTRIALKNPEKKRIDKNEFATQIKEYTRKGYSNREIACFTGHSLQSIDKVIEECRVNETWFSEKEMQEFRRKKQEEMKKYLKRYLRKGYTLEEITIILGCNPKQIRALRIECINNNEWFTKQEIEEFQVKEFKSRIPGLALKSEQEMSLELRESRARQWRIELQQERSERKKRETEQKKQLEQWKCEVVVPEVKKYTNKTEPEDINMRNKKDTEKLMKHFVDVQKDALSEEDLELDGKNNVPSSARKKYVDLLVEVYNSGFRIDSRSIELAKNSIYMHPEFTNKELLKVLILSTFKNQGPAGAQEMVKELSSFLVETQYYDYLIEYKPWIQKITLGPKIMQLRQKGKSNSEVAEILGISSAEVSIIFSGGGVNFDVR